ncbi:MAG: AbrB/MazE/SpoVT family DNA-binding domain-containing protein [Euryarchaeota archaeon]|nr:AbrB/MazE/SpoVT family DNA-binding domain-containing protein [Euryarchaeota archaeon]MDE1835161.1 AbrB/MazE/SpoVT family DNA-binding domain-containing protein [Euryarchaeota archaeon]MDE1880428.1 AbrB/MazE/SpoVT family DNA-binding domain-containing protein [Euryarchaeota archaeon]MDE2045703.1 AbrB/MazE/SpoVT family DNA-binding domain-containing protein [Thermoplasmata archaeon]
MSTEVAVGSLTSKGQITLPKEIREALHLQEGDKVVFEVEGDKFTGRKAARGGIVEALLSSRPWKESSLEFQRRVRREWDRRGARHEHLP